SVTDGDSVVIDNDRLALSDELTPGSQTSPVNGIVLKNASHTKITHSLITSPDSGIVGDAASQDTTVASNEFHNVGAHQSGGGMQPLDPVDLAAGTQTILDNRFYKSFAAAVHIEPVGTADGTETIANNVVSSADRGIVVQGPATAHIVSNTI